MGEKLRGRQVWAGTGHVGGEREEREETEKKVLAGMGG